MSDAELGNYDAIKSRRYIAEDFSAETRFHNIRHVVHVQAALGSPDPVIETEWLQQSADRCGVPHGIIAYADLAAANVREVLTRHTAFPNLRGIRDLRYDGYLTDEPWQSHGSAAFPSSRNMDLCSAMIPCLSTWMHSPH